MFVHVHRVCVQCERSSGAGAVRCGARAGCGCGAGAVHVPCLCLAYAVSAVRVQCVRVCGWSLAAAGLVKTSLRQLPFALAEQTRALHLRREWGDCVEIVWRSCGDRVQNG